MNAIVTRAIPGETPVERINRMQGELRTAALQQRDALVTDLIQIAGRCADVASISCLPDGVKNALSKLSDRIGEDVQNVQSIGVRTGA